MRIMGVGAVSVVASIRFDGNHASSAVRIGVGTASLQKMKGFPVPQEVA